MKVRTADVCMQRPNPPVALELLPVARTQILDELKRNLIVFFFMWSDFNVSLKHTVFCKVKYDKRLNFTS